MKPWRPDNWDVFQIREDNLSTCNCVESWIEAGADAMLEALKTGYGIDMVKCSEERKIGKLMRKARRDYNIKHGLILDEEA